MADPTLYPVFIVGSPRSGTSILIDAVKAVGYTGYSEGNFLTLVRVLERDVDRHFAAFANGDERVLVSRIDKERVKRDLARVLCNIAEQEYAGRPWVDKSGNPEMIEAIPTLLDIWPGSRFIFAKRRAIENVVSRVRKFSGHNFDFHCADWARNMSAWRFLRQRISDLAAIEVDQHEISVDPRGTAARIAGFLHLPDDAEQRIATIFQSLRPQQSEPGSAERVLTLAATGWTEPQLRAFHAHCDEEMRAYGYAEDASYWTPISSGEKATGAT